MVHKAYEENLTLQNGTASKIKQLFWKIGFNHVWENQCSFSKKRLLVSVVKKLRERFINFWNSNLFDDRCVLRMVINSALKAAILKVSLGKNLEWMGD